MINRIINFTDIDLDEALSFFKQHLSLENLLKRAYMSVLDERYENFGLYRINGKEVPELIEQFARFEDAEHEADLRRHSEGGIYMIQKEIEVYRK